MPHRSSVASRALAFQRFFRAEAAGGVLLLSCAVLAFLLANSRWADIYQAVWSAPVTIVIMGRSLSLILREWVNDGLMSIFFLIVGLEIKREIVAGELSSPRQALLPFAGALGGMILPAVVYLLVSGTGPEAHGWGIPMATDIAFALGVLTLTAPRIPLGAKVFLTALAIVDDMGAVVVIALFYSHAMDWAMLMWAAGIVMALLALNRLKVTHLTPYLLMGIVLWLVLHASGVHTTVAGVLLALTIPNRTRINAAEFSTEARTLLDDFDRTETGDLLVLTSKGQQEAIYGLVRASQQVNAPTLRLEHALHPLSSFVVMPLFALANAGVHVAGTSINWHVVLGVVLGLALGKPLGITAASYVAVRMNIASLPRRVGWRLLHGCAWLGGIGFTMSLFIATLAFEGTGLLDSAKLGVLGGSLLTGLLAIVILRLNRAPLGDA